MPFSGSPIPVTSSHSSHASFLHLLLLSVLPLPFMNGHFHGHQLTLKHCHPSTNLPFPMLHTISSLGPFLLQCRQRQQILVTIFPLSEEHSLNIHCHENLSYTDYTHGMLSFKFFIQNPVTLNLNGARMQKWYKIWNNIHLYFSGINVYKVICALCNHQVLYTLICYKWPAATMYQTDPVLGLWGEVGNSLKDLF